jgi:hypothetical protein
MKKATLILLPLLVLITTISNAQSGAWTAQDRKDFVSSCIGTAKANMSEDSARHYCVCMLENVESRYPLAADASKITREDFSTPAWQKLIKDCLSGQWSTKDRTIFITDCVEAAKDALGREKALSYCECMLYKVEKVYPVSADAGQLTAEVLATPVWKKKVQDCLANAQ